MKVEMGEEEGAAGLPNPIETCRRFPGLHKELRIKNFELFVLEYWEACELDNLSRLDIRPQLYQPN